MFGLVLFVDSVIRRMCLILLSGKKCAPNKVYALNKQVSKYMVIHGNSFFSSKIRIVSLVLTHYGFASLCMCFLHLLLDHSTPGYISRVLVIKPWCA